MVVTGGVCSGLGKGSFVGALGALLRASGLRPTAAKADPYLNSDAGTLSPDEHGEVFVLADGCEADLDLGNYERMLDVTLSRAHSITLGGVMEQVRARERAGDFLGRTVQLVPHVRDAIVRRLEAAAAAPTALGPSAPPDVCLVELGGTVGDPESEVFLEALRALARRRPVFFAHVTLLPTVAGEVKTKPTQHSVRALRERGIEPDMLVCRAAEPLTPALIDKLRLHTGVAHIVSNPDAPAARDIVRGLSERSAHRVVMEALGLSAGPAPAAPPPPAAAGPEVRVGIVCKYGMRRGGCEPAHVDAYKSLVAALEHAASAAGSRIRLAFIDAEQDDAAVREQLGAAHGVVVPGGFGVRGVPGKLAAIRHARAERVPFLGICFGLQLAVLDALWHDAHDPSATSEEFCAPGSVTGDEAIVHMARLKDGAALGGTMNLGAQTTRLVDPLPDLYGSATTVIERHRHRFEVSPSSVDALAKAGSPLRVLGRADVVASGGRGTVHLMGIRDAAAHPFFVGSQFHPEFTSRPGAPNPLFAGLLGAAARRAGPPRRDRK